MGSRELILNSHYVTKKQGNGDYLGHRSYIDRTSSQRPVQWTLVYKTPSYSRFRNNPSLWI